MLSSEIIDFFQRDAYSHLLRYFLGIFSADTLPKFIKVNHFLICNTSPSTASTGHWYALFRPSSGAIEYFDSLGVDQLKVNQLNSHLKIRSLKEIEFNETPVQDSTSDTCGHFCLYYIVQRLHNLDYSFDELINEIFSSKISLNERIVTEFYQQRHDGHSS